jgi:hypothetical protein
MASLPFFILLLLLLLLSSLFLGSEWMISFHFFVFVCVCLPKINKDPGAQKGAFWRSWGQPTGSFFLPPLLHSWPLPNFG